MTVLAILRNCADPTQLEREKINVNTKDEVEFMSSFRDKKKIFAEYTKESGLQLPTTIDPRPDDAQPRPDGGDPVAMAKVLIQSYNLGIHVSEKKNLDQEAGGRDFLEHVLPELKRRRVADRSCIHAVSNGRHSWFYRTTGDRVKYENYGDVMEDDDNMAATYTRQLVEGVPMKITTFRSVLPNNDRSSRNWVEPREDVDTTRPVYDGAVTTYDDVTAIMKAHTGNNASYQLHLGDDGMVIERITGFPNMIYRGDAFRYKDHTRCLVEDALLRNEGVLKATLFVW